MGARTVGTSGIPRFLAGQGLLPHLETRPSELKPSVTSAQDTDLTPHPGALAFDSRAQRRVCCPTVYPLCSQGC